MLKLAICLAAMVGGASAASAQPAKPPFVAPPTLTITRPTEAEALAFLRAFLPSDLRREAESRVMRENFVPGLRTKSEMAALLDAFPTLGDQLVAAMLSQMDLYIAEFDERFFPRAAAIVRRSMSREDTIALRDFYVSDLGRKSLRLAAQNADATEVATKGAKGEELDVATVNRQIVRAGLSAFAKLSSEERRQVVAMATSPVGRRFSPVRAELVRLQTELATNPGPKFKAATEKALADTFQRVTDIDLNAGK